MTDIQILNRAIMRRYNDQLSKSEVYEAESNLISFFEMLVSIDRRNKSQAESIKDEQSYECKYRSDSK